ncbi:choice-of-anchor L domain-containing protein [Dokdonia sp. LLG6352-1]|uniref:T9SS type B sorting domain-containing protein n=1 Tax=Dokdonia sp. LLG6352-1 TaxID=3160831 RepID=UPI00386EB72E
MRHFIVFCFLIISTSLIAQNVVVDSQTYTPQQLIEDILIDSNCISNIQVTNVVGGDFGGQEQSYGYFNANGSNFPLQEGIVLSTGRLQNVQGPNTSLSDDDAPDWLGDADLEFVLDEQNTTNATILEFTFQSTASEVRFRYLFASEEYQEGNPNTCNFSDLFGFLIREEGEQGYENIALVPDTTTPVKVTTVHPEIPNGCPAINEFYFESFNGNTAPINFNGQTKVIEAKVIIQPNVNYQVKLVIADEQNFRFDSAVFLEAGSFQLGTDLGPDRTVAGGNPICGAGETTLVVNEPLATAFMWERDGIPLSETSNELTVSQGGFYTVEVVLDNGCEAFGEVTIEFAQYPTVSNSTLQQCDANGDGLSQYNLFDALDDVTVNDNSLIITGFYNNFSDAESEVNVIGNPNTFQNTQANQVVYARVASQAGCSTIASVQLTTGNETLVLDALEVCDTDGIIDGFTEISLTSLTMQVQDQIPTGATVSFYETEEDAFNQQGEITTSFINTEAFNQTIYIRVNDNGQCLSITTADIVILSPPVMADDELRFYCINNFPETITLSAGVISNTAGLQYTWQHNGTLLLDNTSTIAINEPGNYLVTAVGANGCESSRSINVTPSSTATITNVSVVDGGENNTVTITAEGSGVYEYSLGSILGPYQESPTFQNVPAGLYNLFVRDVNGCGITSKEISVIGFPTYFTPNGDGINDTWKLQGAGQDTSTTVRFFIFNRYGKSMYQSRAMGNGWNGIYNGVELPPDDYWYLVELEDGRIFRGHFSLLR